MKRPRGGLLLSRPARDPRDLITCPTCGRRRYVGRAAQGKLGKALFEKRTGLHLSLDQASDATGLDISTYHRAEQGHVPKLIAALKLARWLDRPIEEFFPA